MLLEDEELEQEIVSLIKGDKKRQMPLRIPLLKIKLKRLNPLMMNILKNAPLTCVILANVY
ncbi:Uncharacterised protein [Providencia rettgeri]|nr:Uncharacterised protein [Providencia rettgeri]